MGVSRRVTIVNAKGLHARPSALFVKLANRFESDINVRAAEKQVDGKSIMELMTLAAAQGVDLVIHADGADADDAVAALCGLVERGFDEE